MSIVDQVRGAASADESDRDEAEQARRQLRELDEVEILLDSIGVKLQPLFDISLTARIGAPPKRAC